MAWDVIWQWPKTVVRSGAGIFYEQYSYDSFMAVGKCLLGIRTIPTGVNLYTNGNPVPTTAGGTINLGAITLGGGATRKRPAPLAAVKYDWANNGPNTPIYSASPRLRGWHRYTAVRPHSLSLATSLVPIAICAVPMS